jgi:hypothetical protein
MEKILVNTIYEDGSLLSFKQAMVGSTEFAFDRGSEYDPEKRAAGLDWPMRALSMIGSKRMRNLRELASRAVECDVLGDFIEAGVWRGGACIMMRAVLKAYDDETRTVWLADSFDGLPPSDPRNYPADAGLQLQKQNVPELAVPRAAVEEAFRKFDLLDGQTKFLQGWFRDTLPTMKGNPFSLIRLDGDLYESTMVALDNLYPSLSVGGYCIIDDYVLPPCRCAVTDYRETNSVKEPIHDIDGMGVWWQKTV